jgi:hypothetical protein
MLSAIVQAVNWIIKNIGTICSYAINLLPDSPLSAYMSMFEFDDSILGALNYFVPIAAFLPIAAAILTAYGISRGIWALLRIGKMVE